MSFNLMCNREVAIFGNVDLYAIKTSKPIRNHFFRNIIYLCTRFYWLRSSIG